MKKFVALLLSAVVLIFFVLAAWYLYIHYYTTPTLIVILLLIVTGVLLAITTYLRMLHDPSKDIQVSSAAIPSIETGLIYATITDFCNKIELHEGQLFIAGLPTEEGSHRLLKADYDKLTDHATLEFTHKPVSGKNEKWSLVLSGVTTVAVGDEQFMFYGFDRLQVKTPSKNIQLVWKGSRLDYIDLDDEATYRVQIPSGEPTVAFDWSR
ncbi:MAG: hypothetical protein ACQERC_00585 [Bacteroidota bacterium]